MTTKAGWRALVLALCGALVVAGCGGSSVKGPISISTVTVPSTNPYADVAMAQPGAYVPSGDTPDIMVQSATSIPSRAAGLIAHTKGVARIEQFSMATFYREETAITYAAVNPATFRQFTPGPTATLNSMWDRIAGGEIGLRPDLRQLLAGPGDFVTLGNDDLSERAHIAAYAPLVDRSRIGALLNERWAAKLHMPTGNAILVSTRNKAPEPILKKLRRLMGKHATVVLLAPNVDLNVTQTAVLTGGSVSQAVGSFTYTANKDGSVNPDPSWIRQYIRTEAVPIIGSVTCNKVMLPQLQLALREVIREGLTAAIHPAQYGGCYVPRFIAHDPAKGLSFHTFGTAIDLNVPENQRGTVGQMNRTVVAIFNRCGFNWGGLWSYTDPMHFELARLVSAC